ncbi:LacI family DNA-binding transcriptional regulator [Aeromicrobium sp. CF4.19]|uniref:LacI family DNA-binding transcriptional regulator n=1 Tax=Aeromicrobium sp. CF4.19 TaxID=3373082 RepID=UPI003EE49899
MGATTPTLDEVAQVAGVSRATASRAINGGNRVSPRALAAVEDAVRTLGYSPNPAARSLVTRRTESIALVVPEPDERVFADPFFGHTLRNVNRTLDDRDLQLVLLLARSGEEGRLLRYLSRRNVDGALVVSHHRNDRLAEHLVGLGLPCAFVGRPWTHADQISYVDTDNQAGGRMATRHLLDRGCRRIGTVAGSIDMAAGVDRLAGWRETLAAAGQASDAVAHGDFTEEGGVAAARSLLQQHPDLDGLFVASDLMAVGVMRVLAERGLAIPRDVAVVGYDDLDAAERTVPALTTIRNPVGEMAENATRLLLEQLGQKAPPPPVRVIYPPALVQRDSA